MSKVIFATHLQMQHELNLTFGGENYLSGINKFGLEVNFLRAARMEAFELLESYDWKFWKGKGTFEPNDIDNARVELVDIHHFIMSSFLLYSEEIINVINNGTPNYSPTSEEVPSIADYFSAIWEISEKYVAGLAEEEKTNKNIFELIEEFIASTFNFNSGFEETLCIFSVLANLVLPKDDQTALEVLNELYVSKNALNFFRIQNGYKDGSYVKMWKLPNKEAQEDNFYMQQILSDWKALPVEERYSFTLERLLSELQDIYSKIER